MIKRVNIHGYVSILIFFVALGIADYIFFKQSVLFGIVYISVVVFGSISISLTYCTKCTIRSNCKHFFPGLISQLVKYKDKAYTKTDFIVTIFSVVLMVALPQYWLFENIKFFIVFWILLTIVSVEVIFFVCKTCGNTKCVMCKSKN